jgi:hypothetical protein
MGSVTLAESAKLAQNELIAGVIENVITVNRMYHVLPFDGIDGNALAYNRENALGPSPPLASAHGRRHRRGATSGNNQSERQAAKDAATFTQVTSTLTTIMGDAEVNGLIQATRSGDGNNQTAVQIASKSKSAGRKYQDMLINGDGTNYTFAGLISLCAAGQTIDTLTDGSPLSFESWTRPWTPLWTRTARWTTSRCTSAIRTMNKLLRDLGGTSAMDAIKLPSGGSPCLSRFARVPQRLHPDQRQTKGASTNCRPVRRDV